jgi:putative membrane protein
MSQLKIDHTRVNAAIAQAERSTSGEITCVIKTKALDYSATPVGWAAALTLLAPLVITGLGLMPHEWLEPLLSRLLGWHSIGVSGQYAAWEMALGLTALQVLVFAVSWTVINFTPLKLWLTPKATRLKKAHEKAMEQFYARGLHLTAGRTGVMIFCALEEHFVDVIADEGIYTKVDKALWNDTVAVLLKNIKAGDLTTGFVEAVAACGTALAEHFPPDASNPNELPDVLIEI